jgi:hypothetical protein
MTNGARNYRIDAALRPQPARLGRDFWPTPHCLIAALINDIVPRLPAGRIWEPAAGDGRLAEALRCVGRTVLASDVDTCDFLTEAPTDTFAAIISNPPFNKLNAFISRVLTHLDAGLTQSAVLLLRSDHLTAQRRRGALERAAEIRMCPWRPRWIPGTTTSPRWSFCWAMWLRDYRGATALAWSSKPICSVSDPYSLKPAHRRSAVANDCLRGPRA